MNAQQLKNSILQMAVQGKLVPQDPNDEPASVLLERIREEKEKLIKEGKIKKEKNPSYIFRGEDNLPYEKVGKNEPVCIADEVPFEIPDSWCWSKLNICLDVRDGTHDTPKYVLNGIPLVTSKNICNGQIDLSDVKYISPKDHEIISQRSKVDSGDILFAMIGSIGNPVMCAEFTEFSIKNMALFKRIINGMNMEYVYWWLAFSQDDMKKQASGGVQNFVSLSYLRNYFIPIPPIEEQKRIVEKIESLIPFIEEYDTKERKLRHLNESFPGLLRKSILQQAVLGKLVPQDPNEEPACVLLEKIRNERNALIKAGKLKKDKHESNIYRKDNSHYEKLDGVERCIDDEIPFDIPESWEWTRMGKVFSIRSSKRIHAKDYTNEGIAFYRSMEVVSLAKGLKPTIQFYISKEKYDELIQDNYRMPSRDDLLITCIGGSIGWSWIVDESKFYYKDGNVVAFDKCEYISTRYLYYWLNSSIFQEKVKMDVSGTAYSALTIDMLKNYLIPIPPYEEQKRIVAKIEDVIPYCKLLI